MKRIKGLLSIILTLSLVISIFTSNQLVYAADEYDTLRAKWGDYLFGGTYDQNDSDIAGKLAQISADAAEYWQALDTSSGRTYLWVDYNNGTTVSGDVTNSYNRLYTMLLAYQMQGTTQYNDAALKTDIIEGLDWLYDNWYNETISEFDNWWHWEIGTPKTLVNIMVGLYDDLTATQKNNYSNAITKFVPDPEMNNYRWNNPYPSTGANRIDLCLVAAVQGVVMKDSPRLMSARDGMSDLFVNVTSGDGFYDDGSYVDHSIIPYTNSYGVVTLGGVAKLFYLLEGSTWQPVDPNKNNVYNWVYNSFETSMFKGASFDSLRGRAISRETSTDHSTATSVLSSVILMAQSAPASHQNNFKSLVKEMLTADTYFNHYEKPSVTIVNLFKDVMSDSGVTRRGDLNMYKPFNSMDRAVQLNSDYAFAISKSSTRIGTYELINGENQKGWYTGDGMTYLYNNDLDQYSDDYWATVNYYRLPGTTVDARLRTTGDYQYGDGEGTSSNTWSGGTSMNDMYGATGMELMAKGSTLTARKSWFMFDDELVALGSGITSTDGRTIESIVEQRKINDSGTNVLTVDGTAKSTSLGWTETMAGASWVHLEGSAASGADIGYYFPGTATIEGSRLAQSGTWYDVNMTSSASTDTRTKNYVSLWFDHGVNPNNDSYSYVLLPNKTASQVASYASQADITVVENSSDVHAVKENSLNIVAANFFTDATRTADIITSNKKASIMTKEDTDQTLTVTVNDPTMVNTGTIQVEINKEASGVISTSSGITVTQLSPTIIFTVNVNGAKGKVFDVKFDLDMSNVPTDYTVNPVADAFVRDGSYADTNYGFNSYMTIKKDGPGYNRKGYAKYDFSDFADSSASQATLKIALKGVNTDSTRTVNVYATADESWTEGGITWNNAPANSTLLGSIIVNNTDPIGTYYSLDITDYVNSNMTDKIISIAYVNEGSASSKGDCSFYTRNNVEFKPELTIIPGEPVVGVTVNSNADAFVRDGSYADTNYGFNGYMTVKSDGVGYNRKAYAKFDFGSYLGTAVSAAKVRFSLYGAPNGDPSRTVKVYATTDESWSEGGITWNSGPSGTTYVGEMVIPFDAPAGTTYELDVTSIVNSNMVDKVISFVLINEAAASSGSSVGFATRNNGTGKPELELIP